MSRKEAREVIMSDEARIAIWQSKGRRCIYCHGHRSIDTITDRLFGCCTHCAEHDAKSIVKTSLPCVVCGNEIRPSLDDESGITYRSVAYQSFSDGIASSISGGYGSSHDTQSFLIAICDTCIESKIKEKRLIEHEI